MKNTINKIFPLLKNGSIKINKQKLNLKFIITFKFKYIYLIYIITALNIILFYYAKNIIPIIVTYLDFMIDLFSDSATNHLEISQDNQNLKDTTTNLDNTALEKNKEESAKISNKKILIGLGLILITITVLAGIYYYIYIPDVTLSNTDLEYIKIIQDQDKFISKLLENKHNMHQIITQQNISELNRLDNIFMEREEYLDRVLEHLNSFN